MEAKPIGYLSIPCGLASPQATIRQTRRQRSGKAAGRGSTGSPTVSLLGICLPWHLMH